jgi:hypothetical protein
MATASIRVAVAIGGVRWAAVSRAARHTGQTDALTGFGIDGLGRMTVKVGEPALPLSVDADHCLASVADRSRIGFTALGQRDALAVADFLSGAAFAVRKAWAIRGAAVFAGATLGRGHACVAAHPLIGAARTRGHTPLPGTLPLS